MKWVRRSLVGLVALVAVGVLAGGVIAWRLSHGGIDLAFLLPTIERALARPTWGLTVRIGAAVLEWDRVERRPGLHARDVRVLGADGGSLAIVPVVDLQPSVPALLRGTFAPQTIVVVGARLRAVRTADGGVDLGLAEGEHAGSGDLLRRLRAGPEPGTPGSGLDRIELRHGEMLVTEAATGATRRLRDVGVVVTRADGTLSLVLTGDAELGPSLVPLRVDARYRPDQSSATATLWFDRLVPAAAATLAPTESMRAALSRLELPIGGTLHLDLDGDLALRHVRLDAGAGAGRIAAPELPRADLAVRRGSVAATFEPASRTVLVETLALDLADTSVALRGSVSGDARQVELDATMDRLSVTELAGWWPPAAAPAARAWVTTRIPRGTVRAAKLHVTGSTGAGPFVPDAVTATATFDGLLVRYLDALPEARAVAGTMRVASGRWRFHVARGAVEDLDVAHAAVEIDGQPARARIEVAVRGPVATALRLASRAGTAASVPIDSARAAGVMTGDVRLDVPLSRTPRVADIGLTVSARVKGAALTQAFRGWSFTDGDLDVDVRGTDVHVAGGGRLEGAPVTVAWDETRAPGDRRRRVDVKSRLDTAARTALGFDLQPWLDGPVDTSVQVVTQNGTGTLDLTADLAEATLDVPTLALAKTPGMPARADARLTLAADVATGVERFALAAGASSITGRGTLAANRSWRTLDLAATIPARDAREKPGQVALALTPATTGSQITVTSTDAGALFRALGKGTDASGGRLRYAGTIDLDAAGTPLDGRLEIDDFTLRGAPALARIATLSSLAGIAGALQGGGIPFDRLEARISQRDTTLTIADGVVRGPSLGMLAAGTVERASATADVRGTLVPSYYGLNTAAGRVPVLGRVLTGKGGEGIHAIDFTIAGPLADPRVTVSPVSSVAPGILRDLTRRLGGGKR